MADGTPRTFFSGASLVWSRQRVLWLVYAANFVLAYFATRADQRTHRRNSGS